MAGASSSKVGYGNTRLQTETLEHSGFFAPLKPPLIGGITQTDADLRDRGRKLLPRMSYIAKQLISHYVSSAQIERGFNARCGLASFTGKSLKSLMYPV